METRAQQTTSYKEIRIGNTLYRVTSVFSGEKDLGKTLEQLAIRRAMAEIAERSGKLIFPALRLAVSLRGISSCCKISVPEAYSGGSQPPHKV